VSGDGEERPRRTCSPYIKSPDREIRRGDSTGRPTQSTTGGARRPCLALFGPAVRVAQREASEADSPKIRDYILSGKFRLRLHPGECERFHEAVETRPPHVAPDHGAPTPAARPRRAPAGDMAAGSVSRGPLAPFEKVDQFVG